MEQKEMNELQLVEKDGLYSLTNLWKQSKNTNSSKPSFWLRTNPTKKFIAHLEKNTRVDSSKLVKITHGDNGGTYAHWQVALAYAKFLSPALHLKVNQVFKERLQEDENPELGINRSRQRAIDNYKKQGKDDKWIKNRVSGIETRHHFTDTLSDNGCDGQGIAICTNHIYREVIGGTAKEIRADRGISRKSSIRDTLTMTENLANSLAESLATDKIESDKLSGNVQCAMASKKAGKEVKKAIDGTLNHQLI